MPILYNKNISEDRLLFAYNNNLLEFYSDQNETPLNCFVNCLGFNAILYPNPSGVFYFNFKDYVTSLLKFNDNLEYELISNNLDSFLYDITSGIFFNEIVTFTINFPTATAEEFSKKPRFLYSAEQIINFKKGETLVQGVTVLSPVSRLSNNNIYLKYWEGYPFEISIYNNDLSQEIFTVLKNRTVGSFLALPLLNSITSLFFSDGRTDITIENYMPLVIGKNDLTIEGTELNITLEKADNECGNYFRYLNKYGVWNYWLFSKENEINRITRIMGTIENDFFNLEDTFAPSKIITKESTDSIKCSARFINDEQLNLFHGITESVKIQYFVGVPFARSVYTDWVDVDLKDSNFSIENNRPYQDYTFTFELPKRYNISL
jgi:hypothetical protein